MAVDQPVPPSVGDSPSPVAGRKGHLSGRQKLFIVCGIAAAALTAIVLTHLGSGPAAKPDNTGDTAVGGLGMPYQAPPQAKPTSAARSVVAWIPHLPRTAPLASPAPDAGMSPGIIAASSNGDSAGGKRDPGEASATEDGTHDALSGALTPSDLGGAARAKMMRHPEMTIPAGTVIPCTLQTAINSQLMGFVDCVLPEDVRGATGTVTLLDRGTQVMGEIRHGLFQGQDRLFILWVRARTPQNAVISLGSPAADQLGRAGVSGVVNNHFWQRFGAAILFSVIDAGPQIAASALQHGNNNDYIQFLSPQQQLANTILENQINIPPTLEKNQGDNVSIFVARDLDFSSVYDLRTAQ
jgi:type IV secretion system protein VirB10